MLWLLWRQSTEPAVGIKAATLYSAALWTPFLYIETLIPGTSLLASADVPVLRIAGMVLPPNLIIAIVMIVLTGAGYWLSRDAGADA